MDVGPDLGAPVSRSRFGGGGAERKRSAAAPLSGRRAAPSASPSAALAAASAATKRAERDGAAAVPSRNAPPASREVRFAIEELERRGLGALGEQRGNLPIYAFREELVRAVMSRSSNVFILVGETGSGKSTQLPQYICDAGLARRWSGAVACTQPRRVAALTVARRVAEERGVVLGKEVGYSIRFDDTTTPRHKPGGTQIKFVTDGVLLRETMGDQHLSRYSVVIVDEAHERSLHTDILFALLKGIQRDSAARRIDASDDAPNGAGRGAGRGSRRVRARPLRIVIMSATLDAHLYARFFADERTGFDAPIVRVRGRQHPVDVFYAPEAQQDYVTAVMSTVVQIHIDEPMVDGAGNVLVFLTGQHEIESVRGALEERAAKLRQAHPRGCGVDICAIYAAMPSEQQLRAFAPAPAGFRKGEYSFMYRYITRESCSQFDSLPLTSLTISESDPRDEYCGELHHDRWSTVRGGLRIRESTRLPGGDGNGVSPRRADVAAAGVAARWSRGALERWQVLPPLHRGRVWGAAETRRA
jgi:HrpA-like RNA helicase